MVMPGQFLERPTLIAMDGYCLEGLWHRGRDAPALLIFSPHPDFGGGCMDAPISLELAWAATRCHHATLRFNWRGVGASQGRRGDFQSACEDGRQALRLLKEDVPHGRYAIAGCFFGAQVALEIALSDPRVEGVFLLLSSADDLDMTVIRRLKQTVCLILPEEGRLPSSEQWSALESAGVDVAVIPGADVNFTQGLVQAASEVAHRLDSLGPVLSATPVRSKKSMGRVTSENSPASWRSTEPRLLPLERLAPLEPTDGELLVEEDAQSPFSFSEKSSLLKRDASPSVHTGEFALEGAENVEVAEVIELDSPPDFVLEIQRDGESEDEGASR